MYRFNIYFVSFSQKTDGDIPNLNLGELDLTTDEFILDEVDSKKHPVIVDTFLNVKLKQNAE